MGILLLLILFALELFFLTWSLKTSRYHKEEKSMISLSLLLLFLLLLKIDLFQWSFRYIPLLLIFIIQTISSIICLIKKRTRQYTFKRVIFRFIKNAILFTFCLLPLLFFPHYEQVAITGPLEFDTAKYTWTDTERINPFSPSQENRSMTVEFWYPKDTGKVYPLVVFSHGAFGFSGSNYSTFAELSSHGYVVASIGHTGHAFYTLDSNSKLTTVDKSFITKATEINAITSDEYDENIYKITQEWMNLRTADENFVLNMIIALSNRQSSDPLFSMIDIDKIGLIGHSLGGASSAQVGRDRDDIDAVIVLDGTMLGEEVAFENDMLVLNSSPYPVPILNIYAQDHFENAQTLTGNSYSNFYASKNALESYQTVFQNAGHLNFTDLPLFSPFIAKNLGIGTVDERYCIEQMNEVVLTFFNSFLKDQGKPKIEKEY